MDVQHFLESWLVNDMYPDQKPEMIFAFPPCTNTAVSGARWFKEKGPRAAALSFRILADCLDIIEKFEDVPYMVENPVSTYSTYWRKPDHIFNPCDYGGYLDPPGDAYTKKTCLWVGNGFVMPPTKPVEPVEGSKMHLLPPTEDRAMKRSVAPAGFANAVFEFNEKRGT